MIRTEIEVPGIYRNRRNSTTKIYGWHCQSTKALIWFVFNGRRQ